MAEIIDGKAISRIVREEIKTAVEAFYNRTGRTPQLNVIMVGEDPASLVYVKNKQTACEKVGIKTETLKLPDSITEAELKAYVRQMNADENVSGILIQLPLPKHIDADRVLEEISPEKDVDGLTSANSGLIMNGQKCLMPCTPSGCVELLKRSGIDLAGKEAVIVGRSRLVGLPLFHMLTRENCTVTVCHSATANLSAHTARADILIAAAGKPKLITGDMVKNGAVVIDVGINRLEDGSLCGDVDYESVYPKSSYITPVPGGVGPMTITMLLKNTLSAAEAIYG